MEYFDIAEVKKYAAKSTRGAWISAYILWRPLSPYLTWLFANLRIPSVAVAISSGLAALAATLLLLGNTQAFLIAGAIGIELHSLLDHVDGELARFEMRRRKKSNSRVGHYFDLFAGKISITAMFAVGWAVANTTGDQTYGIIGFVLCFFMSGPAKEPASEIVAEASRKSNMSVAFKSLDAFSIKKDPSIPRSRALRIALFFNELFGFPGWLHLIAATCLLDAFFVPVRLMGEAYLYREMMLLILTPIYFAKFTVAFRHYVTLMLSIKHG